MKSSPKICIYGAGAVGGMIGVRVALAGAEVSVVVRGRTLEIGRQQAQHLVAEHAGEVMVEDPRVVMPGAQAIAQSVDGGLGLDLPRPLRRAQQRADHHCQIGIIIDHQQP